MRYCAKSFPVAPLRAFLMATGGLPESPSRALRRLFARGRSGPGYDDQRICEHPGFERRTLTRPPDATLWPSGRAIVIGGDVWIGLGAVVIGNITIGEAATVGANAAVTRHVAAGATVAEVPAIPIRRVSTSVGSAAYDECEANR
jgi:hypothetical protein